MDALTKTNGQETPALLPQILNLIEDHIELAHLEYRYEKTQSWRQLGVGALTAFCALSAFLFIQVAAILGLVRAGVPLYAICLGLGVVYTVCGFIFYRRFGHRDPRAGEPFQGSREELTRSLQWIQHLLS